MRLTAFLNWWGEGLSAVLPARWRKQGLLPDSWILIEREGEAFRAALYSRGRSMSGRIDPAPNSAAPIDGPAELSSALRSPSVPKVLRLAATDVLSRVTQYPATARASLARITHFDVDRLTPFQSEDVHVGFGILGEDDKQVNVRLVVARKAVVDRQRAALDGLGVAVDVVDSGISPYDESGCNLLAAVERKTTLAPATQRWALGAACLLATLAFPLKDIVTLNGALAALEDDDRRLRAEAVGLAELRRSIDERRRQQAFLEQREIDYVRAIDVLRAVTHAMPDHSWLHRLEINGSRVVLQGESLAAAALPERLDASKLFTEPQFTSPLVRNPNTAVERFTLSAVITQDGEP